MQNVAHGLLERGVAEGRTVSKDLICGLNYEIEKDLFINPGEDFTAKETAGGGL